MQPVQLPEHRIETRRVADLVPADYNPRKISPKAMEGLKKSLAEFGAVQPIVVNERTGHIVGGHQRVKALAALGQVETTVIVVDLSLTREKALNIALNNPHISGEFDDGLSDLLDEINGEMPELFADLRLDELLAPVDEPKAGNTDPDDVPEAQPDPVTRAGDVWVMGEHRLICGDSTDSATVAKLMSGDRADICFTSPPYGVGASSAKLRDHYVKGAKERESFYDVHDDDDAEWPRLMDGWWGAVRPACDAVVCNVQMLARNKRDLWAWVSSRIEQLSDVVIWDKANGAPQMQSNVMSNAFEFIFLFSKNGTRSVPFGDFHGTVSNIVRIDPRGKNANADKHGAVMPTELVAWVLTVLCAKAKTVIDPFCGSGTTIIGAEQASRRAFGIEMSPAYVDLAVTRWQIFTGKTATLDGDGRTFAEIAAERATA